MPHSFIKIWIHAIWATKERQPLITPEIEQSLHEQMHNELTGIGCPVKIINGMRDHVHCLFRLSAQKSIADVINRLKEEAPIG